MVSGNCTAFKVSIICLLTNLFPVLDQPRLRQLRTLCDIASVWEVVGLHAALFHPDVLHNDTSQLTPAPVQEAAC